MKSELYSNVRMFIKSQDIVQLLKFLNMKAWQMQSVFDM